MIVIEFLMVTITHHHFMCCLLCTTPLLPALDEHEHPDMAYISLFRAVQMNPYSLDISKDQFDGIGHS
jgi:hypothetical protein